MPVALEIFLSQLSSSGIVPEEKLKVVVSKKASFADGEALARDMSERSVKHRCQKAN